MALAVGLASFGSLLIAVALGNPARHLRYRGIQFGTLLGAVMTVAMPVRQKGPDLAADRQAPQAGSAGDAPDRRSDSDLLHLGRLNVADTQRARRFP